MRPILKDVAKEANVDFTLVSKILNRTPGISIRPETRRRIEEAVRKLDYRPSPYARALRTGRTNLWGLVVGNLTNEYFAHYADEAIRVVEKFGYRLLFSVCRNNDLESAIRDLEDHQVGGIVCCGAFRSHLTQSVLSPRKGACPVLPGQPFDIAEMSGVLNRAVDFLRENGCTSIRGVYANGIWEKVFAGSHFPKIRGARSEALQYDSDERILQFRMICMEHPDAVIFSGWQSAGQFCEFAVREFPQYRPHVIIWANCRGPFLAHPFVSGVLYSSTRRSILEVFSTLASLNTGGEVPERPANPSSFIPKESADFQALLSDRFTLT
jgi:hypothetical protein